MKPSSQGKNSTEARATYDKIIEIFFYFRPVEELDKVVHPKFLGYGTAAHEFFKDREALRNMAVMQAEQLRGTQFTLTRKPVIEKFLTNDSTLLVLEDFELYMQDNNHTLQLRLSTILEKESDKWVITHFHGSTPDKDIDEEEAFPMEGLRKKNEELEAKIKERTRDLEIETALEKVRTASMAMQKGEELANVISVVFAQLKALGIDSEGCTLNLYDKEEGMDIWMSGFGEDVHPRSFHISYFDHPYYRMQLDDWKNGEKYKVLAFEGDLKKSYDKQTFSNKDFFELPEDIRKEFLAKERKLSSAAYMKYGMLEMVGDKALTDSQGDILSRFAKVFEQAYTRFLDIQQAESQAREAMIEAALERVRSRSMGMQKSEELKDVVKVIFDQLAHLNINADHAGIVVDYEPKKDWHFWIAETQDIPSKVTVPYLDLVWDRQFTKAKKKGKDFFTTLMDFEEKNSFYEVLLPHVEGLTKKVKDFYFSCPGLAISTAIEKDIGLYIENFSGTPYSGEENEILRRFAKVFQQTYTRFLDLKNAEAQARESQIEAALEKVRSRTMAMQHSDELPEAANVLFLEVQNLDIPAWSCGYNILSEDKKSSVCIMSSEGELQKPFTLPLSEHESLKPWYDAIINKEEYFVYGQDGEDLVAHYDYMKSLPELKATFEQFEKAGLDLPVQQFNHLVRFNEGFLLFITYEAVPEAHDIFKRFGKVFAQTYTRFLDLQKAEAQAREAQIETALERVRSRSMAMHKSEELADLSLELVKQVQALGVDTWFCAFNIYDDESKGSLEWGSNGQGTFPEYRTPMEGIFLRYYKAGQKGETLLINEIGEDECPAHYDYLCTLPGVGEQLLKMKDAGIPFPTSQIDHVAFFKYGYVLFITYEPSPESHEIFKRFAKVFEQTYTRFLDLQKAEAQAKEAQIEAALEKVRSQSLAMHTTSEMQLVANAVYHQLQELGVVMDAVGMSGVIEEKKDYDVWIGGAPMGKVLRIPYNKDTKVQRDYNKAIKERPDLFARTYSGKIKEEYVNHLLTHGDFPRDLKRKMVTSSAFSTSISFAKNSSIQIARYSNNQYTAEENEILKRFAKVFEQAYIRFMDLQKAEAQAKEAQIEAALEKVRSASLAMHQSKDLHNVLVMLYNQLDALGLKMHSAQISESIEDPKAIHSWIVTNGAVYPEQVHIPFSKNIYFKRIREAVTNGESFYTLKLSKQQKDKHFHHIFDNSSLKNVPQERKDLIFSSPGLGTSNAMGKYTSLSIMRYDGILYSEEENEIIKRFAKVFEQSYTRFLDIQKAESQAKEAQIEAALEKVRSRSMAMHNSSEMLDVIEVVSGQLRHLNLDFDTVSFATNDQKGTFNFWMTSRGQPKPIFMEIPHLNNPVINRVYEAKKNNETFISDVFSAAENKEWTKHLIKNSDLKNFPEPIKKFILNAPGFARSSFFLENIDLYLVNYRAVPFAEEDNLIFQRFAKVFEQAYTRFLDLQKAEARIREAQIEAALEKVRSRTMAMHKSQELHKVVLTVSQEIRNLGLNISAAHIYRFEEGDKGINMWIAGDGGLYPNEVYFPYFKHQFFDGIYHARTTNKIFFTMSGTSKKEKNRLYRHLLNNSKIEISEDRKKYVLDAKSWAGIVALGKYSGIGVLRLIEEVEEEFSVEEYEILKRLSKVFEQAYIRFLDLQKAEAQAREAQIEAALEKVRSASLAMHQSKDLHNVLVMLYNQLASLGLKMHSAQIIESIDDFKELHCWIVTNGVVYPEQVHAPFTKNIFFKRFREAVTNGESFYTLKFSKRQKDNLFHHFFDNTILRNAPQARKDLIFSSPGIGTSNAIGKYTSLSIMRYDGILYSDEENEIIKRFLKVFEQSYTRFLDLQKAESQAREAQIEAALERVRSKAMAMHSSDDLADTVEILYKELDTLQVHALRFGHAKVNSDTKIVELHTATDLGKVVGQLKLEGHPLLEEIYEHYLAKEDLYYALQGEEMKSYYAILGHAIDIPIPPMDTVQHGYFFFLEDTANYAWSDKALDEEELKVYRRLIKVLNLTYKRYEELKKAETQAREAQIEAALERVRSKTMAMHNSQDVAATVVTLFDEVQKLGLDESIRCGIGILEGNEKMETWSVNATPEGKVDLKLGMLDMSIHPLLVGVKNAWKTGKKGYSYELKNEDVRNYYSKLNEEPEYSFNVNLDSVPDRIYHRISVFSAGVLFASAENPFSEEASKILDRFAGVFGQTYRRYLDLLKAEIQARDALKQATLDRVRGQIASMRSTEDLERITPLIWNELKALEIPFIRCGVFIIDESSKTVQAFLSAPDGHSLGAMKIPFDAEKVTAATVAHWKKNEVYRTHWDKSQFLEFMQLMKDLGQVSNEKEYQGAEQPPESLHLHFVPFTQGMLYVGNTEPLDGNQIELVQTLADAFAIAYARYEDFVKLERAKEQVENTLEELKATQNQLVQSEKMASLGELTAGIAHEIQNPLNFVNNFSEVSVELLEEMLEEMSKGDLEEAKALMEDIKQNLDKINHHGKRADGIVKGMLQHSRTSSGEKELTDLNVLADEYLRLAYHGLRAKDKTFNATLETHFDESIGKVNILAQDMGRVILNLITNAFYAVKEKSSFAKASEDETYEPTVTVSTKKTKNGVEISVKDNGNGIPKSIKDKIFQPFFTTKPTGEGTGLGLSMSYDIVTKWHGGELRVDTKKGQGTEFTIELPVN
ncbi:ATP-binding protein [Muriicola sp. E247]|uniref:ATP-binding protein n=1 Tax=Muriicola sp. E247 TaxID=3242730 RepID=UPI00352441CA